MAIIVSESTTFPSSFPSGINLLQLGTLFGKVRTWICTPVLCQSYCPNRFPCNFL